VRELEESSYLLLRGGLAERERGGIGAGEFLEHRDALAAFGGASERLVDFGDAALLLFAYGTDLAVGEAITNAYVHGT
jgi:hypothetical protein